MESLRFLLVVFLGIMLQGVVMAQSEEVDTTESLIYVDRADHAEFFTESGVLVRKLAGNVAMHQDTVFMRCDTAILMENQAIADGHISIQQGDSLVIFADSLVYDSQNRLARLFGEVILQNGDQEIHTHLLSYDLRQKMAYYEEGAVLKSGDSKLFSKRGSYFTSSSQAYFKDSVSIIDPEFSLHTDTLAFNTSSKRAKFLAPTLIQQGESTIYCEAGYYDLNTRDAEFRQNAQYRKGQQEAYSDIMHYDGQSKNISLAGNAHYTEGTKKASADKIIYVDSTDVTILEGNAFFQDSIQTVTSDYLEYSASTELFKSKGRAFVSDPPNLLEADLLDYDQETGLGTAIGRVIWRDTAQQLVVYCDTADYRRKDNYLLARGSRPLLENVLEGDTLYMRCDTILVEEQVTGEDTVNTLSAFRNVRVYKSDMQAVCDSLAYHGLDSLFQLYYDPIVWSDTSQFFADTIYINMQNEELHHIEMDQHALLVNSEDLILFNQIAGRNIIAYFRQNELRTIDVKGNAKSVYYALDEQKAYLGINKVECSSMRIFFGNNEVERIRFYTQPKGEMQPIQDVNPKAYELEDFKWEIDRRPQSKEDL